MNTYSCTWNTVSDVLSPATLSPRPTGNGLAFGWTGLSEILSALRLHVQFNSQDLGHLAFPYQTS